MSPAINIAIIGAGIVGSAFINQLRSVSSLFDFNVIYLAKSKSALISYDFKPLNLANWKADLDNSSSNPLTVEELLKFLKNSPLPAILVDNTSSADVAVAYPQFVSNGISVATPNKKAFSGDLSLWSEIFKASGEPNGGLVYHEATVGAGLPVISTINDLVNTGDKIEKIEGIFSGSLSYIFNRFSTTKPNDIKFSEIVSKAKELGYTEPDPRDDLSGLDVARKVTILARLSGFNVKSPDSFPVDSLVPQELETLETSDEFLSRLHEFDSQVGHLKEQAASEGKVLRFVGSVDFPNNKVSVGFGKYDASHPFASLQGSDNVISIKTERYQNPLIIQGAGAGAEVTAAGVLADVIKIGQRISKL
ncbi:hypothetical protein LJB42_002366 [Komagataella kurtzmanii]|nr:hypothetical protein LJB42_002366 [Komagataella kurtzmanii]